ncbi:aminotransferase class IV family protein [Nocardia sp. NPDC005978]|uniref:aminotransferase class IV family protein n=1 Tax=Nocardia sp. NPDC005978 TaxID=3156725 RepID=UPI0033A2E5AF
MNSYVAQLNGQPATASDLTPVAFAGYAHFTAMQVRDKGIRGLDLHLDRLRNASMRMFGHALPDQRIREHLRTALADGPADLSLTATVFSPAGEFTVAGTDIEPQVLIRTGPPASGPSGPLALDVVEHERALPSIKHVGEVAKTYYLREAVARGFDDAAFIDRNGRFSEATIWNLAFWDGSAVVWPEAEMLRGTTMGIVQRQLERLGVPQVTKVVTAADLPGLSGAVVMNSWNPGISVHRIGGTAFPRAVEFTEVLQRAYDAEPAVLV